MTDEQIVASQWMDAHRRIAEAQARGFKVQRDIDKAIRDKTTAGETLAKRVGPGRPTLAVLLGDEVLVVEYNKDPRVIKLA